MRINSVQLWLSIKSGVFSTLSANRKLMFEYNRSSCIFVDSWSNSSSKIHRYVFWDQWWFYHVNPEPLSLNINLFCDIFVIPMFVGHCFATQPEKKNYDQRVLMYFNGRHMLFGVISTYNSCYSLICVNQYLTLLFIYVVYFLGISVIYTNTDQLTPTCVFFKL